MVVVVVMMVVVVVINVVVVVLLCKNIVCGVTIFTILSLTTSSSQSLRKIFVHQINELSMSA